MHRKRLRSLLLYLCYVFRALINSLCVLILHERSGARSVSDFCSECIYDYPLASSSLPSAFSDL